MKVSRIAVLLCTMALWTGCGGEQEPTVPDKQVICWGTLTNRMAYLAGWMSKTQCGIIDNTKDEHFAKIRRDGTCSVAWDIEGGAIGRFDFVHIPETQEARAVYVHPGNPNDGVANAWPCPSEVFQ